ncbi:hypothetical protein ABBQ38_000220 [Trebouxia sp. C0009 RCD-2024]
MTGPDAEPERVAVKRVNAEDGSVNHKMVEQEVFMLKGLQALRNNSHTVPLYAMHLPDAGHPTDPAYLIMGLAEGKDVYSICSAVNKAVLKAGPGPELQALKAWAWQFSVQMTCCLAEALRCCHTKGFYHRDLKPHNIVVSGWSGGKLQCKLVDWASGRTNKQTGRCNQMYTPEYASPEIVAEMSEGCSPMLEQPNDLWAWGVCLHQIFTCTSLSWQPAFGSVCGAPDGMSTDCIVRAQASLSKEQASWAEARAPWFAVPDDKVSGDKALDDKVPVALHRAPHPIIAGICQAARFASADSTTAEQAAGLIDLLGGSQGLLHTTRESRILARAVPKEHPWLSAAGCDCMPLCPIPL